MEEGGEKWSKPHVATLSLHALFETRRGIMNGTVLLECDADNLISAFGKKTFYLFSSSTPIFDIVFVTFIPILAYP